MSFAFRLAALASLLVLATSILVGWTLSREAVEVMHSVVQGGDPGNIQVLFLQRALWVTGGVAAAGVLIATGTGLLLAAPLSRLRRATREMADGEYSLAIETVPIGGPRESRDLALAFRQAVSEVSGREKELRAVNEVLRRTEATRDAMSHMLVHDLKGPVGNVTALLGLLEAGHLEEEDRVLVAEAAERSRHLLHMIEDLLDLAQIEADSFELERGAHEVSELMEEALSQVERLMEAEGFKVQLHLDEQLPQVDCDAAILKRVLVNLFLNALKHGRSPIELRCTTEDHQVGILVEDGGEGVPEGAEEQVFQKFNAGGPRRGAGLGLAFARLALNAHGGAITVRGARFTIYLPSCAA